jgi:hypothetical protein
MTTKIRASSLANTGVTAGTYGGSSQTPIVRVDAQGRITFAANTPSISIFKGTSGSAVPNTGGITLTSDYGITITATSNTINIATPQDLRTASVPNFYNLTLSTALPVTSGGTGVTTKTGTGSVVLNTSPSLVTPALGTPASGVLTNCTNYGGTLTTNQIINALGYTPYSSANPTGYLTSSSVVGSLTSTNTQVASLGVGTAASGTAGEIRATNDITAFYTSDIRFKENVQEIPNALDKVCSIGGKTFDWTEEYINNKGGVDEYFVRKADFGVIAQDVQSAFPLATRTKPDGTLAVDYEKLCALAFAAIKELKAEIDVLKGDK